MFDFNFADILLKMLVSNTLVFSQVSEVRRQTRAEKKRLAMAMREKQLGALGMQVGYCQSVN